MTWQFNVIETGNMNNSESTFLLAEDIYNSEKVLIAAKGMIVTEKLKETLSRHQIKTYNAVMQDEIIEKSVPESKKHDFKIFKMLYDKQEQETESMFSDIKEKGIVCIDKAYRVVHDILKHSDNMYDTLAYLNYLRDFDNHTYSHCNNVGILCNIFGRWLGYSDEQVLVLTVAGLLHDIGKINVPFEILNKPGKLSDDDFIQMQLHVRHGYNMLKNTYLPNEVKMAALMHHEKVDGTGYMVGLKGEAICDTAKIVSICDVYDAMVSKRAYKRKFCPLHTIVTMEAEMRNELCWEHMYVFRERLIETFVGNPVTLSNGLVGEIVHINHLHPTRPLVKVDTEVISLLKNEDLYISKLA